MDNNLPYMEYMELQTYAIAFDTSELEFKISIFKCIV